MRTYYIFKINNLFSYMYKNKPYKIYKILEEIYHTRSYDMVLTYKLYEQVAVPFHKISLNEYIYYRYQDNDGYMKKNNIHVLSNDKEGSKLVVNNSNLKIKTNINYPDFFLELRKYKDNLFICDFINKDYFWLDKVNKNDGQNRNYLVK